MNSIKQEETLAELEVFLPRCDRTNSSNNCKISIISAKKDMANVENGKSPIDKCKDGAYNPFKERKIKSPTTDFETITHLLKAALGSGILSMPFAFKCAGFGTGIIVTLLTGFICTFSAYMLVLCAHCLYYKTKTDTMSYSQVTVAAFSNGPKSLRGFSNFAGKCVSIGLFITYFGSVSVYTVVAAYSFKEVIQHYTSINYDIQMYIVSQLPVLIVLSYIPNLKVLAPFSMLANLLFVVGLGITVFSMVFNVGLKNPLEVRQIPISSIEFPQAFTITVFAMEAIGVLMPLENNMENPNHLIGTFGVLNRGMSGVTLIYMIFGGLGFLAYGDEIEGGKTITSNLDINELGSQVAKLSIAVGVLISYVLQYFVCLNIVWDSIKDKIEKNHTLYNYIIRTVIVTCSVMLAAAVPSIGPFVGLIGAVCFSFLGIIFPVLIYFVTFSNEPFAVLLIKYSFFIVFGLLILFFGSYSSVLDITALYYRPLIESSINGTSSVLVSS